MPERDTGAAGIADELTVNTGKGKGRLKNENSHRTTESTSGHCLSAAFGLALAFASLPAAAQQWTPQQRAACEPDAMRLCNQYVPDVQRVSACMSHYRRYLSPACRAVFYGGQRKPLRSPITASPAAALERPRRRAAEQRYEFAVLHSTTSSGRPRRPLLTGGLRRRLPPDEFPALRRFCPGWPLISVSIAARPVTSDVARKAHHAITAGRALLLRLSRAQGGKPRCRGSTHYSRLVDCGTIGLKQMHGSDAVDRWASHPAPIAVE